MKNVYTLIFLSFSLSVFSQYVTHGPIVGAVTDTSCRVFVRTDTVSSLTIELSSNAAFTTIVASATVLTDETKDTVAIADITGLIADVTYYVRAVVNGNPMGRSASFMTFPAAGTAAHQV